MQLLLQGLVPIMFPADDFRTSAHSASHIPGETPRPDLEGQVFNQLALSQALLNLLKGDKVVTPSGRSMALPVGNSSASSVILLYGAPCLGLDVGALKDFTRDFRQPLEPRDVLRVYVEPLSMLNLDDHHRISNSAVRTLRFIVQSFRERGRGAAVSLGAWRECCVLDDSVLFSCADSADIVVNTSVVYELAVLKSLAEPLLRAVPLGSMHYTDARTLLALTAQVEPLSELHVSSESALREFIGAGEPFVGAVGT